MICLGFCTMAKSQDITSDLKKTFESYSTRQALSIDIAVVAYATTNKIAMQQKATLLKQGEQFFYRLEDTEMLVTQKNVLLVNHYNKTIVFRAIDKKEYEYIQKTKLGWELDTMLANVDSIRYEAKGNNRYYEIFSAQRPIHKTDVLLDVSSERFDKITYHYNQTLEGNISRIEITFQENNNPVSTADFSEKKYIVREGSKYKLSNLFRNYDLKIVDNDF
jgi:hypothetical protein